MRHYPGIVLRLILFHTSEKSRIKYRMRKHRERVKYFQHSKRNFVSPSCHVIVYFLLSFNFERFRFEDASGRG